MNVHSGLTPAEMQELGQFLQQRYPAELEEGPPQTQENLLFRLKVGRLRLKETFGEAIGTFHAAAIACNMNIFSREAFEAYCKNGRDNLAIR
ncbi:hypothetical protein H7X87_01075, partial [Acetobacteraceae bacterium]|nr:hypothetical protein [Candidatus Parcubacteria bacterium]